MVAKRWCRVVSEGAGLLGGGAGLLDPIVAASTSQQAGLILKLPCCMTNRDTKIGAVGGRRLWASRRRALEGPAHRAKLIAKSREIFQAVKMHADQKCKIVRLDPLRE